MISPQCFNPCFNGTYSLTKFANLYEKNIGLSFNPCFIVAYRTNNPLHHIHSEPLQKICIASLKKAARFPLLNLFIKVVNLSSVI